MTRLRATWRHADEARYLRPGGPWDTPSLDIVVTTTTAAIGPGKALLVDGVTRLDGPALRAATAALAGALRRRGVRHGDAVAWQLPNWHEAVLLYRACWRLGAVAAPVHHLAGEAEVAAMLDQVEPAVVLGAHGRPAASAKGTLTVRGPADAFTPLLHEAPPVTTSAARPADLAVVLFTSGSSGEPKGVLHSQRGLAHKARLMADVHGLRPADSVLMPAPLAHVSGLLNAVLIPGVVPMKAVLMDRWDPQRALELIGSEQVSFMIGPPTFFVSMQGCSAFDAEAVAPLRLISSGGAGVTPSFAQRRPRRSGAPSSAPTAPPRRPPSPPAMRATRRSGPSHRRPAHRSVELRVTDPSTGRATPVGKPGESGAGPRAVRRLHRRRAAPRRR